VTGTVTLQRAAPAGGIDVTLDSSDTALVRPPAKVMVPEGATAASAIATSAVTASALITINTGTANDNYRAPETRLTLLPAGSPRSRRKPRGCDCADSKCFWAATPQRERSR